MTKSRRGQTTDDTHRRRTEANGHHASARGSCAAVWRSLRFGRNAPGMLQAAPRQRCMGLPLLLSRATCGLSRQPKLPNSWNTKLSPIALSMFNAECVQHKGARLRSRLSVLRPARAEPGAERPGMVIGRTRLLNKLGSHSIPRVRSWRCTWYRRFVNRPCARCSACRTSRMTRPGGLNLLYVRRLSSLPLEAY